MQHIAVVVSAGIPVKLSTPPNLLLLWELDVMIVFKAKEHFVYQ